MKACSLPRSQTRHVRDSLTADFAVISGHVADALRAQGYACFTVMDYQRPLRYVARLLRAHGRSLNDIDRQEVPAVLRELLPKRSAQTIQSYRAPVNFWLRATGRFHRFDRSALWQPWVDDFIRFSRVHRGLGSGYLEHLERGARAYLAWQFGTGRAVWKDVRITDIWDFAHSQAQGTTLYNVSKRLSHLRRFLSFVQLQGACSQALPEAVPHIAAYAQSTRPQVLSLKQRRQLLASFTQRTPAGRRDYAMTLCMMDLGLRALEVTRLRCSDLDLKHRTIAVPGVKSSPGRQLPLAEPVFSALRHYVQNDRPVSASDRLFLRHFKRHGQPLTAKAIKATMRRAYRRCDFPRQWNGTHRLRHTFASRLYRGGAELKLIADLMGHRHVESTNVYLHTDLQALRRLVQPWPV